MLNSAINSQTRVYGISLKYFKGIMVTCYGIGYTDGRGNMQAICSSLKRPRPHLATFQPDGIGRTLDEAYKNARRKVCPPEYFEYEEYQDALLEDLL